MTDYEKKQAEWVKAHDVKPGDLVRVVDIEMNAGNPDWPYNSWGHIEESTIGLTGRIDYFYRCGVKVNFDPPVLLGETVTIREVLLPYYALVKIAEPDTDTDADTEKPPTELDDYARRQAIWAEANDIKEGSPVEILFSIPPKCKAWGLWAQDMDATVGKYGTVDDISSIGVQVRADGLLSGWWYPYFCLGVLPQDGVTDDTPDDAGEPEGHTVEVPVPVDVVDRLDAIKNTTATVTPSDDILSFMRDTKNWLDELDKRSSAQYTRLGDVEKRLDALWETVSAVQDRQCEMAEFISDLARWRDSNDERISLVEKRVDAWAPRIDILDKVSEGHTQHLAHLDAQKEVLWSRTKIAESLHERVHGLEKRLSDLESQSLGETSEGPKSAADEPKRDCSTCKHGAAIEGPEYEKHCAACQHPMFENWEPEHSCETCRYEHTVSLGPCASCDQKDCNWTPKESAEGAKPERSCTTCEHWPVAWYGVHCDRCNDFENWTPKKGKTDDQ